jgi:hypothetical protein
VGGVAGSGVGGVAGSLRIAAHTMNIPNDCPLVTLNNNPLLDLRDTLLLQYGSSNDANPYIDHPLTSTYHDTFTFPSHFSVPNQNIFLSLNIRSLMANFSRFSDLILDFVNKGINIIAIALQETWSVPYHDMVHIPGFNFVVKTRSQGRGGGVCFYINSLILYKILDNLSNSTDKDFECLTVELNTNGKKNPIE